MRLIPLLALSLAIAAPASAATPAKPAAKPVTAAKPAAPKPAAKPSFNARDPATIAALLNGSGAQAEVSRNAEGQVSMKVVTPGGGFGMQFADCDATGKTCAGVAFSTAFERQAPTLGNFNQFNRTQFACRGFISANGKPSVMYSTLLTSRVSSDDMKQHLGIWQGCLAAFSEFTRDPNSFLASME